MHTLLQGQECQAWDLGRDPAGGTLRTRAGARGPALTGATGREVRVSNPKFKRWPQVSGQYEDIYQIHWGAHKRAFTVLETLTGTTLRQTPSNHSSAVRTRCGVVEVPGETSKPWFSVGDLTGGAGPAGHGK